MLDQCRALFVDDEWESSRLNVVLPKLLMEYGIIIEGETDGSKAVERLRGSEVFDVLLLDILFENQNLQGQDVFDRVHEDNPDLPVIIISNTDSPQSVVQFVRHGAINYFAKAELQAEKLSLEIRNAAALYREKLKNRLLRYKYESTDSSGMVYGSKAMQHVVDQAESIASLNTSVLILGESGTGKELVADIIHNKSSRVASPFLRVNCATIPHTLADSILFGHQAGAFTDAKTSKRGLFELSHRGTLFLDEISEMPIEIQSKLLRTLETGVISKLGFQREQTVDVRIIAATNRDLSGMVLAGTFREDLYYRLNVYTIQLPPLRQRPSDLEMLTIHFIKKGSKKLGCHVDPDISEIMPFIKSYHWPGNVRQLENALEAALINCRLQDSSHLMPEMFQIPSQGKTSTQKFFPSRQRQADSAGTDFPQSMMKMVLARDYNYYDLERHWKDNFAETLSMLIAHCGGDGGRLSDLLEIPRNKLSQVLYRWGLKLRDYR